MKTVFTKIKSDDLSDIILTESINIYINNIKKLSKLEITLSIKI